MSTREKPVSFVQITGAAADIDELPFYWFMADARPCDLHGHRWIEMPSITAEQASLVTVKRCQIHHVQTSPYSQGEWQAKCQHGDSNVPPPGRRNTDAI